MGNIYHTMHATSREPSTTGEAAPARHPAFKGRQKPVDCRGGIECFREFRIPLVGHLPAKGSAGIEITANIRSAAQAFNASKGTNSGAFDCRPAVLGLFNRPLDVESYRRSRKFGTCASHFLCSFIIINKPIKSSTFDLKRDLFISFYFFAVFELIHSEINTLYTFLAIILYPLAVQ